MMDDDPLFFQVHLLLPVCEAQSMRFALAQVSVTAPFASHSTRGYASLSASLAMMSMNAACSSVSRCGKYAA